MKKLTTIFAVVLVCVLAVTVLVACGPNNDYDSASANLKANGYTVTGFKASENDTGKIEAKISAVNAKTGDSIEMTWYKDAADAKEAKESFDKAKKEAKETLDAAKKKVDESEGLAKEIAQAAYDTVKAAYDKMYENMVYGKIGNLVYSGTKDAVSATR